MLLLKWNSSLKKLFLVKRILLLSSRCSQAAGRPDFPKPAGRPDYPKPAGRPKVSTPAGRPNWLAGWNQNSERNTGAMKNFSRCQQRAAVIENICLPAHSKNWTCTWFSETWRTTTACLHFRIANSKTSGNNRVAHRPWSGIGHSDWNRRQFHCKHVVPIGGLGDETLPVEISISPERCPAKSVSNPGTNWESNFGFIPHRKRGRPSTHLDDTWTKISSAFFRNDNWWHVASEVSSWCTSARFYVWFCRAHFGL